MSEKQKIILAVMLTLTVCLFLGTMILAFLPVPEATQKPRRSEPMSEVRQIDSAPQEVQTKYDHLYRTCPYPPDTRNLELSSVPGLQGLQPYDFMWYGKQFVQQAAVYEAHTTLYHYQSQRWVKTGERVRQTLSTYTAMRGALRNDPNLMLVNQVIDANHMIVTVGYWGASPNTLLPDAPQQSYYVATHSTAGFADSIAYSLGESDNVQKEFWQRQNRIKPNQGVKIYLHLAKRKDTTQYPTAIGSMRTIHNADLITYEIRRCTPAEIQANVQKVIRNKSLLEIPQMGNWRPR